MAFDAEPVLGNWYHNVDEDVVFEVVDLDEDEGLVEIQHEDGDLAEVDLEQWREWDLELVDEPEDWTGADEDIAALGDDAADPTEPPQGPRPPKTPHGNLSHWTDESDEDWEDDLEEDDSWDDR